ncbi:MAG: ATP-binding protein [Labilithrix sp.]|nr:ATP-binding protein [Labilithrix sp.]MBX3216102.1 ATP-binding protein [Labilithrix sp.]
MPLHDGLTSCSGGRRSPLLDLAAPMNDTPASVRCVVAHETAVFAARTILRAFATRVGFDREVIEELAIVVSELASNILKYGRRGHIDLSLTERDEPRAVGGRLRGITIVAEDETPPFDLAGSLRDGYDTHGKLDPARVFGRGGIGAGLGAVRRLSDSVELVPTEGGKRIIVRRFVGRPRRGSSPGF